MDALRAALPDLDMVLTYGGVPRVLGVARDDAEELRARLTAAAEADQR